MDSGEVEHLIKLFVLGRKNWLFLGSDAAGHRAASGYSLVLSCYRLGMDPWAYLRDVLLTLSDTRFPASRSSSPSCGPSNRLSSDRLVDAPFITRPPCRAPPWSTPWAGPEAYAAISGVHRGRRAASNHSGSVFVVAVFVVIAPRTLRPLEHLHYLGWSGGLLRNTSTLRGPRSNFDAPADAEVIYSRTAVTVRHPVR